MKVVFPEANFIYLRRNGYKVITSFYNKFPELMYNKTHSIKQNQIIKNSGIKNLPLDKRFLRPLFSLDFNSKNWRFKQLCSYWNECENLSLIHKIKSYKFEDLIEFDNQFNKFVEDTNLDRSLLLKGMQKPVNVGAPINYKMLKEDKDLFIQICEKNMNHFNYKLDGYEVKY